MSSSVGLYGIRSISIVEQDIKILGHLECLTLSLPNEMNLSAKMLEPKNGIKLVDHRKDNDHHKDDSADEKRMVMLFIRYSSHTSPS